MNTKITHKITVKSQSKNLVVRKNYALDIHQPSISGKDAMAYLMPELENLKAFCTGLKLYQSANVLMFLQKILSLELIGQEPETEKK